MGIIHMSVLLLSTLLASLASTGEATTRSAKAHALRHTEQSVVVIAGPFSEEIDESATTLIPETSPAPSPEAMEAPRGQVEQHELVGSMAALLQSEKQVLDPTSPAAEMRKNMTGLIWLERVFQQNLAAMDKEGYSDKLVAHDREEDGMPSNAEMLGKMRLETAEFSAPLFREAVSEELQEIRERQQALLDQIITVDSEQKEDQIGIEKEAEQGDDKASPSGGSGIEKAAKQEKQKQYKALSDKERQARDAQQAYRRNQSDVPVIVMACACGALILIVAAIFLKVHLHMNNQRTASARSARRSVLASGIERYQDSPRGPRA